MIWRRHIMCYLQILKQMCMSSAHSWGTTCSPVGKRWATLRPEQLLDVSFSPSHTASLKNAHTCWSDHSQHDPVIMTYSDHQQHSQISVLVTTLCWISIPVGTQLRSHTGPTNTSKSPKNGQQLLMNQSTYFAPHCTEYLALFWIQMV